MKTSDLIAALSTGAGPAPRAVVARRLLPAAAVAWLVAAAAAWVLIGPAPADTPTRWAMAAKLAYALLLAAATGWLTARLARPAAPVRAARRLVIAVLGLMAVLGMASLLTAPAGARWAHLLGHSALQCPWNVLALSLPGLAGALWALRGLVPTRARAAGLAAGLFAGSLGAAAYALACPETSIAFVATWYTLGVGLSGALGALLAPRLLRW